MPKLGELTLKRLPLSRIDAAKYNPRADLKPGDPEYEKLKASVEHFGYVDPLVWNKRTGTLVGGHQRLKILVSQGVTEVDVSVVDLGVADEKSLNLALNKIAGRWDDPALAALLSELQRDEEAGIAHTGFGEEEVERILMAHGLPEPGEQETNSVFEEQVWGVIIEVDSEEEEVKLIEQYTKEGYRCRALL